MTCDEAKRLVAADPDAPVDAGARRALDAHLASCAACRDAQETQRFVHALLVTRPDAPVAASFARRVVQRARAGDAWLDAVDWRKWTWRLSPVAGALFLLAMFAPARPPSTTTTTATPAVTAQVGVMEKWAIGNAQATSLPATALLWRPGVTADRLLVTVLTTAPDAALEGNAGGR